MTTIECTCAETLVRITGSLLLRQRAVQFKGTDIILFTCQRSLSSCVYIYICLLCASVIVFFWMGNSLYPDSSLWQSSYDHADASTQSWTFMVLRWVSVSGPITALAAALPRRKVTIFGRLTSGPGGGRKEGPQGRNGSVSPLGWWTQDHKQLFSGFAGLLQHTGPFVCNIYQFTGKLTKSMSELF